MNCAACGKKGESLKLCAACKTAKYCGMTCQEKHRKDHREECKQKEMELKAQEEATSGIESLSISAPADQNNPNSDLWKSPPRPDCPICMLPLPLCLLESVYMVCCGKTVCGGCLLKYEKTMEENRIAHRINARVEKTCPFCRQKKPDDKETLIHAMKRMKLNDSKAFFLMARCFALGDGVPKDERKGLVCLFRAVELGDANAYFHLANMFRQGNQIDSFQKEYKELLQLAAMGGVAEARHRLGSFEYENCHFDLALRHWQISAGAGFEDSLHCIKVAYKEGHASKTDFAKSLRAYQAAQQELKSEERDAFLKKRKAAY